MSGSLLVKDIASITLSIAALALAVFNFVRTSRMSRQQYHLSFRKPVIDWAITILDTMNNLFSDDNNQSNEDARQQLRILARRFTSEYAKAALIIFEWKGDVSGRKIEFLAHPISVILSEMSEFAIKTADAPEDIDEIKVLDQFGKLYGKFASEIQFLVRRK